MGIRNLGFTDKNIRHISGAYNIGKDPNYVKKTEDTLNQFTKNLHDFMQETGLNASHISSILTQSANKLHSALVSLTTPDNIQKLEELTNLGFSSGNISSILNSSGNKAGDAILKLTKQDTIVSIQKLKEIDFTTDNLSLILRGSKDKAADSISRLTEPESINAIEKLKEIGFTSGNISRMAHLSGIRAADIIKGVTTPESVNSIRTLKEAGFSPTAITEITTTKNNTNLPHTLEVLSSSESLLKYQELDKIGFEPKNISMALAGIRNASTKNIDILLKEIPKLVELTTIFSPKQIATKLSFTHSNFEGAIDELHKKYEEEINSSTNIAADSQLKIHSSSKAAESDKSKNKGR